MVIYKVKKRNGKIVTFDKIKIENAIKKAIESAKGKDFSLVESMGLEIIELLEKNINGGIPNIEQIQDTVEEVLIKHGHDNVAKNYILYRENRAKRRTDKNVVIEVSETMNEYLEKLDWRVNANANSGYSLGGMI